MSVQHAAPYFTALLLGITSGISQCSVFCAPFISAYINGLKRGRSGGSQVAFLHCDAHLSSAIKI